MDIYQAIIESRYNLDYYEYWINHVLGNFTKSVRPDPWLEKMYVDAAVVGIPDKVKQWQ